MTDRLFSDHMLVMTTLKSTKPPITFKEQHTYRKIKSIDIDLLTKDLAASDLCKHTPDKLNGLVDCLVKLGKIIRQTRVSVRPWVLWYNEEILIAKRRQRKAEKKWRVTKSIVNLNHYKLSRNFATNLMNKARTNYYENLIDENSSDQAKFFKVTKHLTESNKTHLPPHSNTVALFLILMMFPINLKQLTSRTVTHL